jgi:hypothetical protein
VVQTFAEGLAPLAERAAGRMASPASAPLVTPPGTGAPSPQLR